MPMIVCVCRNVNDRRIAECARGGVRSIKQLCRETGAGTCCGKCVTEARRVLQHAIQDDDQAAPAALMMAGQRVPARAVNALRPPARTPPAQEHRFEHVA